MNNFNSVDDSSASTAIDSMERISEIESELVNDANHSVVIVILLAFLLVLMLAAFATYAMAGDSEIFTIPADLAKLPVGR